jgi:hypothetical protein
MVKSLPHPSRRSRGGGSRKLRVTVSKRYWARPEKLMRGSDPRHFSLCNER